MKKILFALLALATSASCFNACSSDDIVETAPASSACIVSGVTLGKIPCVVRAISSEGTDSFYVANISGEYYPMTIDHYNGRIFNVDSLPYGTDVAKVTFYRLSSSGVLAISTLEDSNVDTLFVATDSTDFTHPRKVTVFALDNLSSRSYMMEVRVHQEYGDSFIWRKACEPVEALQNMNASATLTTTDSLYVFGTRNDEHVLCATALNNPSAWTTTALNMPLASVVTYNDKFYAVSQERLVVSEDARTWATIATAPEGVHAVLAQPNALTMATSTGFYTSADGTTWTSEMADEPEFMPTSNVAMMFNYASYDPNFIEVYAVGETSLKTVVWKHNLDLMAGDTYAWNYYPESASNKQKAPYLENRQLYAYDGAILMTGNNNEGTHALYMSQDGGRTWNNKIIPTCDSINSRTISAVDKNHFVWLISQQGEVYRGRYNRLGWVRQDVVFQ